LDKQGENMKKSVLSLCLVLSTAFLVAGGNLAPVEPVEAGKVCHTDVTYVETIRDDSDLMWQDAAYGDTEDGAYARARSAGKAGNWNYSKNYCRSLYYAGYSDWSLPTSDELQHVHRIPGQVFKYFRDKDFWTSTPAIEGKYYVVYPADAYIYKRNKRKTYYIRCVRCIGDVK
jgi:hypothetical protein